MEKGVKHAIQFVVITFLISWSIGFFVKFYGNPILNEMLIYIFMFSPAIAAFIMRYFISKEKLEGSCLQISKGRNYVYAWLALFAAIIIANLISVWIGIKAWDIQYPDFYTELMSLTSNILLTIVPGTVILLGEEFGWRDYMLPKIKHLGTKAFLIIGVIWGVWHWPLIWAGYTSTQFPAQGYLVIPLTTIVLSYILGIVYLKTRDIWLVAFMHAAYNNLNSLFAQQTWAEPSMVNTTIVLVAVFAVMAFIMNDIWKTHLKGT